jgi:glycosyltransferase involved in cell wall biosynthesis
MQKPLVSIVLPVYNREKYLSQAIDSVLQQTYYNWEMIIADDNSQQQTKDLLQQYTSNTNVCIYHNSSNLGLFANLNKAIKLCKGEYILILCSDDFLWTYCIESNLDLMQRYQEADLILSSTDAINADGKLISSAQDFYYDLIAKQTKLLTSEESLPLLLQYGSINGNITGMFFKKSLYEKVGDFKEDWRHAADWEWIYRVANHSPILLSRVNVAAIRVHQEQLSVVNGKNLSASLEGAEMVKKLLANPRLKTFESAPRWASHIMQHHLWYAIKLALKGNFAESLTIAKAVNKATGFSNTFWAMIKLLPQRWKVRRQKTFLLPPN